MQAALHPTRAVHQEVDAAHHRSPEREDAFVRSLRVEGVGRTDVAAAVRHAVSPAELPADHGGAHVLGRAECRRAGLHVDVAGEPAVHHRRAGVDQLDEGDAGEGFGVLLGECTAERDRGHRSGEREGGDHHGLVVEGELDHALSHRDVEPERRVGVDDGDDRRFALERRHVDAACDADHLEAVDVALTPEAVAVQALVGHGEDVVRGFEVSDRRVDVDRLDRIARHVVDDVEHLRQAEQILEALAVADAAHAVTVDVVGRTGHRAEGHPAPADAQVASGVPAVQSELRRCRGDRPLDQFAWEPHPMVRLVDIGTCVTHDAARLRTEELHTDALEDRER